MICAATHLTAQQLYTDTFKLADQQRTVEIDEVLLDIISKQSTAIHANDTTDTLTLAELIR